MKKALKILLVLVIVTTVLASIGAGQVAADPPNFKGNDQPCQNEQPRDSNKNCPQKHGQKVHHGSLAPLLILAPLGLRGKSLESLLD